MWCSYTIKPFEEQVFISSRIYSRSLKFISSLLLSFNFSCELLPNHTEVLHCTSILSVALKLFLLSNSLIIETEPNLFFFFSPSLVLCIQDLGNIMLHRDFQNICNHLFSPPSLPLSVVIVPCFSYLSFYCRSFQMIIHGSRSSCCIIAEWDSARLAADLVWGQMKKFGLHM